MRITQTVQSITTEAALAAVTAAIAHANSLGVPMNAAVVDRSGTMLAFLRSNNAPLHSLEIAIDKAYTAVSFGLPTKDWDERLATRSYALRHSLLSRPNFAGFGGGLPIVLGGERIGAIGLSGGSEEQDIACAQAGVAAIQHLAV